MSTLTLLDCTLRDGGYYNAWDFEPALIQEYLDAMSSVGVAVAEFGFRSTANDRFLGGCAFSAEAYIETFRIPDGLQLSVMVNTGEIVSADGCLDVNLLEQMFPSAVDSRISMVRLATHFRELVPALEAVDRLSALGYQVVLNLMQIDDKSAAEIEEAAGRVSSHPVAVLYFADSLGSMTPERTREIVQVFRRRWGGELGIHAHDNMSRALVNTKAAVDAGVTWIDGTVTGMGRGPGNAKTEFLVLEFEEFRESARDLTGLLSLIKRRFEPMRSAFGWGTNPYYFLAGKYGIHPTFVQSMLTDTRFEDEDILSVLEHLRGKGGRSFDRSLLNDSTSFYVAPEGGSWCPREAFAGKDVLILGNGPGASRYAAAIAQYINRHRPVVIALNAEDRVAGGLVDFRVACHPIRLLADCEKYRTLPQPLITPVSQLPEEVRGRLEAVELRDYGISIDSERFSFDESSAVLPKPLVFAYALAVAASGGARGIYLAGFDGYAPGDLRNEEMDQLISLYRSVPEAPSLRAITPSRYKLESMSVFGMNLS